MKIYFLYEVIYFFAVFLAIFINYFNKKLGRYILNVLTLFFLIIISFRLPNYNLDAYYYSLMFENWNFGLLQSWLIKLEPIHFILRNLSPTLTIWFLTEGILFFLAFIYFTKRVDFSASIFMSSITVTLASSSFRFSLSLVLIGCIFLKTRSYTITAFLVASSHLTSLFIFFKKNLFLLLLVLSLWLLGASVFLPVAISERLDSNLKLLEWETSGLKLVIQFFFVLFFFKKVSLIRELKLSREIFIAITLFVMASIISGILNRAISMCLAVLIAEYGSHSARRTEKNKLNNLIFLAIYWFVFVIGPSILVLIGIDQNVDWQMNY